MLFNIENDPLDRRKENYSRRVCEYHSLLPLCQHSLTSPLSRGDKAVIVALAFQISVCRTVDKQTCRAAKRVPGWKDPLAGRIRLMSLRVFRGPAAGFPESELANFWGFSQRVWPPYKFAYQQFDKLKFENHKSTPEVL